MLTGVAGRFFYPISPVASGSWSIHALMSDHRQRTVFLPTRLPRGNVPALMKSLIVVRDSLTIFETSVTSSNRSSVITLALPNKRIGPLPSGVTRLKVARIHILNPSRLFVFFASPFPVGWSPSPKLTCPNQTVKALFNRKSVHASINARRCSKRSVRAYAASTDVAPNLWAKAVSDCAQSCLVSMLQVLNVERKP